MIKLLEQVSEAELKELETFCEASCIGVKAIGPLLSYGTAFDFAMSWVQRNETGRPVSFLSKVYGTLTAYVSEQATEEERKEVRTFLKVIGYEFLVTTPDISGLQPTGPIMVFPTGADCIAEPTTNSVQYVENDRLKDFYTLITQNNPGYLADSYSDWLVDFSHRLRHGTAHSVMLQNEDGFCSTAAALVITEHTAFFGAVSTNPECRGNHYAYSCIRHLAEQFSDRKLYLLCMPEKQAFYERAGMVKCGEYTQSSQEDETYVKQHL